MAVFDVTCGPCDSALTMDVEDEHTGWVFLNRWASAHVECGWIVNINQPDGIPTKLVLGPEDLPDPKDLQGLSGDEDADTLEK